MQKPWQQREGQQPYWHCHGSRISHGTESLISGNNSDRIDLLSWLLSSPGCWRQLTIPSVLGIVVCPELLQGTRSLKVLWSNNVTVNMMIVKVFCHCQWETSQSHIKLINWRTHRTKICQDSLKWSIGQDVQAYWPNRLVVLTFQELGTFSIKVNDWKSGKSLDIFSTGEGRGAERK